MTSCARRLLFSLALAMAVISPASFVDTILSVSGPDYAPGALGGSSFQILGSAWSSSATYANVTIPLNLSGSHTNPPGTEFLMTRIVPGTRNRA